MSAPRWARALITRAADPHRVDEAVGDLEEAHQLRVTRHGRIVAVLLTSLEALDMARALRRAARPRRGVTKVPRRGLPISLLDFKLGIRMLVRYPVLSLVAGFAMAFTVWVGAGTFEVVTQILRPRLPLEDGDRIVALQLIDAEAVAPEPRIGFDFLAWRQQLRSVVDIGAVGRSWMNLGIDGEVGGPVIVASMTASGFQLARVTPQIGRFLLQSDESDGTAPVLVLSYDLWESRFGADPDVIGRSVLLGRQQTTVVGVMPEGFGFPVAEDVWIPLRSSALSSERRAGAPISVFGRLREEATLDALKAELDLYATQMASAFPDSHRNLVPEAMPYARAALGLPPGVWPWFLVGFASANLVPLLLLLLIAANVALLMFARAATRESEMVVRAALGAGRARIVGQLFAEALVLGGLAAAVGLAAASRGLQWVFAVAQAQAFEGDPLPFWIHASLSPMTIVYAVGLTLLAATLAGVLPGLKVTRPLGDRLKASSAGGGGLHFGGVWTAVIVAQVAVTIPFPAVLFALRADRSGIEEVKIDVPVHEYLVAHVELEAAGDTGRTLLAERYAVSVAELERRLEADPRVLDVTQTTRLPRMYHPWNQIEVMEGATAPPDERGHRVGRASVALDYFDALGAPILAGRAFGSGDLGPDAHVVIVNSSFVDRVLGGRNAVGQHVQFIANESAREPSYEGPWYEIVGVVRDLGAASGYGPQGVYHPLETSTFPVYLVAHVPGDPAAFVPSLRSMALSVDAGLELHDPIPLQEVVRPDLDFYDFWITLILVVSVIALVLSLAGIYAAMSFAVSRRTREIGIRVALGAGRRGIVWSIFKRPLIQLGGGIALGAALTAVLFASASGSQLLFVAAYVTHMTGVTLLACIVPTRRALGVEPSEALRSE